MVSPVSQRIRLFLQHEKISCTEFGKRIGASAQYVNSMKEGPSLDRLYAISLNFPALNLWWLLFGEGEMLREPEKNKGVLAPDLKTTTETAAPVLSSGERAVYEKIIEDRDRQIAALQSQLLEAVRRLDASGGSAKIG